MNGFVTTINYDGIRLSLSMTAPTALYAYYGNDTNSSVMVCSPVGPNCNFISLTQNPQMNSFGYNRHIVLLADPNIPTRFYIGGYTDYSMGKVLSFTTGATTYSTLVPLTGIKQHADGRFMVMDAKGYLLEGIIRAIHSYNLLQF